MSKRFNGGIHIQNAQEIGFYDSDSSNFTAFKAPAALSGDVTFILPDGDASTSGDTLSSDAAGNLSWVTRATPALDNLASVAINTSLVSDTDNTDDLGSAAVAWANAYANIVHMDSNSETTAIQGSASATASVTYSLPVAGPASNGFVLASQTDGTMSWVSNASSNSHTEDWDTADTATFAITHGLSSKDVIVQIYDKTDDATVEVDSVVRTDANTVTVSASAAPPVAGWRVVVIAA